MNKLAKNSARQHVPVAEYAANLEAIAARMAAAGIERVVFITPPPVYEPGRIRHLQEVREFGGGEGHKPCCIYFFVNES
jgi:hypothetical protein